MTQDTVSYKVLTISYKVLTSSYKALTRFLQSSYNLLQGSYTGRRKFVPPFVSTRSLISRGSDIFSEVSFVQKFVYMGVYVRLLILFYIYICALKICTGWIERPPRSAPRKDGRAEMN